MHVLRQEINGLREPTKIELDKENICHNTLTQEYPKLGIFEMGTVKYYKPMGKARKPTDGRYYSTGRSKDTSRDGNWKTSTEPNFYRQNTEQEANSIINKLYL